MTPPPCSGTTRRRCPPTPPTSWGALELPAPFDAIIQDWIDSQAYLGFGPRAERFAGAGIDWWVCPGTSGWNSLVGRWSNARGNALDAVTAAADFGATGMLVTEWGDNGHLQPPTVMLPALTYAASVAWCRATNEDQDTAAALDAFVLPDTAGRAGAALLEAGEVYGRTGVIQPNGSALHDAVAGGGMGGFGAPTAEALAGVEATLVGVDDALAAVDFTDADGPITQRELRQAVALARHGAQRLARPPRSARPRRRHPRRGPRRPPGGAGRLLERPQPPRRPRRQPGPAPAPLTARPPPIGSPTACLRGRRAWSPRRSGSRRLGLPEADDTPVQLRRSS